MTEKKIVNLLPEDEEVAEDEQLYSDLVDGEGKLKVDLLHCIFAHLACATA